MTKDEAMRLAFKQAFQLGQDYWYQAYHDYVSQNKKSDVTKAKFEQLMEDAIKETLAQPEQELYWKRVARIQEEMLKVAHEENKLLKEKTPQQCYCGDITRLGVVHRADSFCDEKPAQKYRRGNRLLCFETEEYCVIHISGTDRQLVKFPDSHLGVYTNEQVAELFELLPKEPEQEPVAWRTFDGEGGYDYRTYEENENYAQEWDKRNPKHKDWVEPLYISPPQREPLTDEEIYMNCPAWLSQDQCKTWVRQIEAAHGIKE